MNIIIKLEMPQAPLSTEEPGLDSKESLLEKVDYAIDCFLANEDREESFAFLRRVYRIIVTKKIKTKTSDEIMEKLSSIMQMYAPHELEGVSYSRSLSKEK